MDYEVEFRHALASDYDAVMGIDQNVYGGFDYLPKAFFWYIHSPDYLPVVGTVNGRVATYSNYVHIGENDTVVATAGRISEEFRGSDLVKKMLEYGQREFLLRWPNVTHSLSVVIMTSGIDRRLKRDKDHVAVCGDWNLQLSVFTPEVLREYNKIHSDEPKTDTRVLPLSDITTPKVQQMERFLSTQAYFLIDTNWVALKPTSDNIKYAARGNDVIASFSKRGRMTSLSFYTVSPVKLGVKAVIHFNGKSTVECLDHVNLFFKLYAKRVANCDFVQLCSQVMVAQKEVNFRVVQEYVCSHFGKTFVYPGYEDRHDVTVTSTPINVKHT